MLAIGLSLHIEKACFEIHDPCKCGNHSHKVELQIGMAAMLSKSTLIKCILVAKTTKKLNKIVPF